MYIYDMYNTVYVEMSGSMFAWKFEFVVRVCQWELICIAHATTKQIGNTINFDRSHLLVYFGCLAPF